MSPKWSALYLQLIKVQTLSLLSRSRVSWCCWAWLLRDSCAVCSVCASCNSTLTFCCRSSAIASSASRAWCWASAIRKDYKMPQILISTQMSAMMQGEGTITGWWRLTIGWQPLQVLPRMRELNQNRALSIFIIRTFFISLIQHKQGLKFPTYQSCSFTFWRIGRGCLLMTTPFHVLY